MEQLSALLLETRIQAAGDGTEQKIFRFRAHSVEPNRLGYILTADGWELENFRRNPVFLAMHRDRDTLPIGRVPTVSQEDQGLVIEVIFDQEDPLAVQVQRKYEQRFLNAVSVGFSPLEVLWPQDASEPPKVVRKELLEVSAVPVPGDAAALRLSVDGVGSPLLSLLDPAIVAQDLDALRQARDYVDRQIERIRAAQGDPKPANLPDPIAELAVDLSALAAFASR